MKTAISKYGSHGAEVEIDNEDYIEGYSRDEAYDGIEQVEVEIEWDVDVHYGGSKFSYIIIPKRVRGTVRWVEGEYDIDPQIDSREDKTFEFDTTTNGWSLEELQDTSEFRPGADIMPSYCNIDFKSETITIGF